MEIRLELAAWQFELNGPRPLQVGGIVTAVIDGGAVTLGDMGGAGTLQLATDGRQRFVPVALSQYAICGMITDVTDYEIDGEALLEFVVDCGVPVRFTCLPASQLPLADMWVSGLVNCSLTFADESQRPLGRPLIGVVGEIQLLGLRPWEPGFGELHAVQALLPLPYGPDLVYVTLQSRGNRDQSTGYDS